MFKKKTSRWTNTHHHQLYELVKVTDVNLADDGYVTYPSIINNWVYINYYHAGYSTTTRYGKWFRKVRTYQEKRKWFDYCDQLNEVDLKPRRRKRSANMLTDSWDDFPNSVSLEHERSWKKHTKCRKQWMKNL